MKVLWLSNRALSDRNSIKSGTWLFAMRDIIENDINLINLTDNSTIKKITHIQVGNFEEYILPFFKIHRGLPSKKHIAEILTIIDSISPDIIHIWGTEHYWAQLLSRGFLSKWKVILEVQGLIGSCANVFYAGLTASEIHHCHALKDFIKPSKALHKQYLHFMNLSRYEHEVLSSCDFISTQSDWTRDQIRLFIPQHTKVYKTLRPIRKEFTQSKKWSTQEANKSLTIFTSTAYSTTFKGLHILIKALSVLKNRYTDCTLCIAGLNLYDKPKWKHSGYERLLLNIISQYNLQENIRFLGPLTEQQIITQLLQSHVYVNSSFVESYSAATAEALILGVPSVLAYSGAMPNFSSELPIGLYYSPMDYIDCAAKIDILYTDPTLRNTLTQNAIHLMSDKCDNEAVRKIQLDIYNDIIKQR